MVKNDLTIYDTHAHEWWNGDSPFVRGLHALVPVRMKYFDGLVASWSGLQVADVGCGGGLMSVAMAQRGARVTGIDPSGPSVDAARAHARKINLPIEFKTDFGESLPLETGSQDVVVCVDVLEHVQDLNAVIREFSRVLKPEGLLLFDTINRNWFASLVMVRLAEDLLGVVPRGTHDPAKFIRPDELTAQLQVEGFREVGLQGLTPAGINRNKVPVFWRVPFLTIMYLGQARRS